MNMEQIIAVAVEKGINFVLSLLVIYAIWQIIKHAPTFAQKLLEAFTINTAAIDKSTLYLSESKDIHQDLDRKIDAIQDSVDDLKSTILLNAETSNAEIINKLNKLEEEVRSLK